MIINVGTKNPAKIEAVKEVIRDYNFLSNAKVISKEVPTGVSNQPQSLGETISGAMHRALGAFENCDYSIGLESGLFPVPSTRTGYMNVCAGSIFDGTNYYLGLSPAFEYSEDVMKLVFEEGLDVSQAYHKLGLTDDKYIGFKEGAIGLLTKGRITRKDQAKLALTMALIHIE